MRASWNPKVLSDLFRGFDETTLGTARAAPSALLRSGASRVTIPRYFARRNIWSHFLPWALVQILK
jgi:hypothetical protein